MVSPWAPLPPLHHVSEVCMVLKVSADQIHRRHQTRWDCWGVMLRDEIQKTPQWVETIGPNNDIKDKCKVLYQGSWGRGEVSYRVKVRESD